MEDWYQEPEFRGHVREPDVADLRYIALDMGLREVQILGRNWMGYVSRSGFVRLATWIADRPLRMFPSLCADIYLTGHSPTGEQMHKDASKKSPLRLRCASLLRDGDDSRKSG